MDSVIISPVFLALVPLVIGLTSIAKLYVDSQWAPLISLGLGVALACLNSHEISNMTFMAGIVIGLTASGGYSGAKATMEPILNQQG